MVPDYCVSCQCISKARIPNWSVVFWLFWKTNISVGGLFSDPVHQAAFKLALMEKDDWEQPFQLLADSVNVSISNSLESRRGASGQRNKIFENDAQSF